MRISANQGLQVQRSFFQNHQASRNAAALNGSIQGFGRTDSVTLSPLSKANSILESLTKQKQGILESKEQLISSTLKNGGNLDNIKEQIKSYDNLLKDIDKQITQALTDQATKGEDKKQASAKEDQPKTKEEAQAEKLNSVLNLSANLDQIEAVSSTKDHLDRKIATLESEVSMDSLSGGASASKTDMIAGLEARSEKLMGSIAEELTEAGEQVKEHNQAASESVQKESDEDSSDPTAVEKSGSAVRPAQNSEEEPETL